MNWLIPSNKLKSKQPLTRHRLFSPTLALLLIAASVGLGQYYQGVQAATSTTATLNGYKISSTGASSGTFSSAKVTIKTMATGAINSSTASPFLFSGLPAVVAGSHYIVSPSAVPGYTIKGLTFCSDACVGYVPLTTNFRAVSSIEFVFTPGHDYHMRWIYQPIPVATPTPLPPPVKTPIPAPAPPKPAPVPTRTPAPRPVTPVPAPAKAATPVSAPVAALVPLGLPTAFTATNLDSHAEVALQWAAATGSVKSYTIERSSDQITWQVVTNGVTETQYTDKDVGFGIHYYYRLKAVGQDGVAGGTVNADVTTSVFTANTDASRDTNLSSADQLVNVVISSGAISDLADCQVNDSSDAIAVTKGQTKIAGPYELVCKTSRGEIISSFAKPVTWTYHLKDHLKNGLVAKAYILPEAGKMQIIPGAAFDKASQDLLFTSTVPGKTLILASSSSSDVMIYVLIGIVVLLVLLALGALFFIRMPIKQSYEAYIRSKYYDL